MNRTAFQMVALIYLLTVPAGAYVYFMEPNSEYTSKTGAVVVIVLTIVGFVLCAIPEHKPSVTSESPPDATRAKVDHNL